MQTAKSSRTVARSFRISEHALQAIEEESKRQNVTVSAILNQQLLAYADYERFAKRIGLIKMSTSTLRKIIQAIPDGEIERVGLETGRDVPKSLILAKFGTYSLDTSISYLQILSEFANQFEFGEVQLAWGAKKVITLLHVLGLKGSIFLSSYVRAMFEQIGHSPKISFSEHSVVIDVPPQRDVE